MGPEMLKNERFIELVRFFMNDFLNSHLITVKIEAVRLVQRIMMLAPELLPASEENDPNVTLSSPISEKRTLETIVLPNFVQFLSTPSLRASTIACLKIIVETKPALVHRFFNIEKLFNVLDDSGERELESIISSLIRSKMTSVIIETSICLYTNL